MIYTYTIPLSLNYCGVIEIRANSSDEARTLLLENWEKILAKEIEMIKKER